MGKKKAKAAKKVVKRPAEARRPAEKKIEPNYPVEAPAPPVEKPKLPVWKRGEQAKQGAADRAKIRNDRLAAAGRTRLPG